MRSCGRRLSALVAAFALVGQASVAAAAPPPPPGSLDLSFAGDGSATTRVGVTTDEGRAVVVQPDGGVVVAGTSDHSGAGRLFTVVRFLSDGRLDPGFDGDGVVTTAFDGNLRNEANAVALDSQDRIVVAGVTYANPNAQPLIGHAAVARYLPDGTLDTSFGGDGTVSIPLGANDAAQAVAVQSDGRIVVAGISSPFTTGGWMTVARYDIDGSLDPSFHGDGIAFTDIGSSSVASAVRIAPGGNIVVAGRTLFNNFEIAVTRYLPSGGLDGSFGGVGVRAGVTVTDVGFEVGLEQASTDVAAALDLMDDGRVVVAGLAQSSRLGGSRAVLLRYDVGGRLDSTFGTRGIVVTPSGLAQGYATAVDSDGRALVAGEIFNGSNFDMRMLRYRLDGTLDPTFGTGGVVTTDVTVGNDRVRGMVLQADGRIVLAGFADTALAAVRYHGDPPPDTTPPGPPTLLATDPESPANANAPRVIGVAEDASTVRLYTGGACAGDPAAIGAAAELASPGIALSVADDTSASIRATATDQAGNVSVCSSELTYAEDSTPPDTTITAGPQGITDTATPAFEFASSEAGSSFECRVDAEPFSGCTSPARTGPLGNGPHTFEVRAHDTAGNSDESPAIRRFRVCSGPQSGAVMMLDGLIRPVNPAAADAVADGACR